MVSLRKRLIRNRFRKELLPHRRSLYNSRDRFARTSYKAGKPSDREGFRLQRLDKDSTIYNFTLIRKIRHLKLPLLLYGMAPLSAAVYLTITDSPLSLLWFAGGLLLLPLLYSAVAGLNIRLLDFAPRGAWSYIWRLPWIGLLPNQYSPLQSLIRIHHQLLWIGLAAICWLYPWMAAKHWLIVIVLHLWYILPRYWFFFLLQRTKKKGLLKINTRDTSYYVQ